jgi:uncharacterized protein YcbX
MARLRLTEIWIYPIKSLGGIRVKSAKVFEKGLQYDRRWMLIDSDNNFMTQRFYPKMALFKTHIKNRWLLPLKFKITYFKESISISSNHSFIAKPIKAIIWDDQVEVYEVDPHYSNWFSNRLGMQCKLVSFPENNSRLVDERYQINREHVSLADAYPLLLIGEQSLADLNSRLDERVPMNRFRPNLVFSGGQPYDEDKWKNFSVGKNKFRAVKPCARCVLTTVNQDTAEKGVEPLATLSKYRKEGHKVLFGQNLIAIDHEEIHEGDEITFN